MDYEKQYQNLLNRSIRIKLLQHQKAYFLNGHRGNYLKFFKEKLLAQYQLLILDEYVMACMDAFMENNLLMKGFDSALKKIQGIQKDMYNKLTADVPLKAPQIYTDFIYGSTPYDIIRMLITYHSVNYYAQLIDALEKANRRGEIGAKQERLIFEKAIKGLSFVTAEKNTEAPVIGFALKGTGRKTKLSCLFNALKKEQWLDATTSEEQFMVIFSGEYVREPVRWRGTISQIVYLIGAMVNKDLIQAPTDNDYGSWLYPRIIASFLDKHGNQLKVSQLKDAKNAINNKDRNVARGTALTDIVIKAAAANWNSTENES